MGTANPVIQTHGLGKTFGRYQALRDLTLSVPAGSIVGFLGPNGAGKSTTIKLLLGLSIPSAGGGSVFGLDIRRESAEVRRRVGYLAQSPRFYEHLTPREVLDFTARFFFRGSGAGFKSRIEECLEMVGLEGKLDRPVRGFSGGERQRLGIAQALVNRPDLLILDEPAAALDPQGRRDVLAIMEKLRGKSTIFFSTHILDDVQRVSDRVVILNRGALVAEGPVTELLAGSQGLTYRIRLDGDGQRAQARLQALPWVHDARLDAQGGVAELAVTALDEAQAQQALLRTVLEDPAVQVLEFTRSRPNLEEVFLQLVEGGAA